MATTKKVTTKKTKTESNPETNYCTMQLSTKCKNKNGTLPVGDFYSAYENPFYVSGRFNICKHCLKEYVYIGGDVDKEKFKNILRIFDIPFLQKEFESAEFENMDTIGAYMKNVYLNYKGSTWLNSDGTGNTNDDFVSNDDFKLTKEIVKRWGKGFSIEEYQWLEEDYVEWCLNHESEKMSMQRLFQMICVKELEIRNARQQCKSTEKLEKALMDLMNSSNLTPRTMSAINETDSAKIYGMWIRDIERYRPAEYFKDKKLYSDYDGIKDYFDRFVLRPMKNLLTGSRDFDKEFSVEDEVEGGDN